MSATEEVKNRRSYEVEQMATEDSTFHVSRFKFRRPNTTCKYVIIFTIVICVGVIASIGTWAATRREEKNDGTTSTVGTADAFMADESPVYDAMSERQKYYFNLGVRLDKDIQDCKSGELKYSFPNLDYAFLGYDILKGYPLAESHDPGLTNSIFAADYSMNVQSADCRYALPNGVLIIPDVSCVTSFSSTEITNEKELAKSLAVSAEISGGGYGVAFSASAGYKQAKSSIEKENSVLITSTARCDYYFVKLLKETPPAFHTTFLTWLPKLDRLGGLSKNESKKVILEFFDRFGTHFLTEVTFGARFTYEHKMQQSSYQKMSSSSVSASVRASYSGAFSVGGGFSLDSDQREAALEFSKSVTTRTVTVGAAPPSNGDALTWASTVQSNPVPTKYKLSPIEDLFVSDYMQDTGIDYDGIRSYIIRNKEFYQEYRKKKDEEILRAMNMSSSTSSTGIDNWRVHEVLEVEGGKWGDWKTEEYCPPGMYAVGYNLKIEPDRGDGDDTGLNAIKLFCGDKYGKKSEHVITSGQQIWGDWGSQSAMCETQGRQPYFLNQFSLQFYDFVHIAAVFANFTCQDLNQERESYSLAVLPGENEAFGRFWRHSTRCPSGTAICGIKTKIEKSRGSKDDSALNNAKFYCCGY